MPICSMNARCATVLVKVNPDADIRWITILWLHVSNAWSTVSNQPHIALAREKNTIHRLFVNWIAGFRYAAHLNGYCGLRLLWMKSRKLHNPAWKSRWRLHRNDRNNEGLNQNSVDSFVQASHDKGIDKGTWLNLNRDYSSKNELYG